MPEDHTAPPDTYYHIYIYPTNQDCSLNGILLHNHIEPGGTPAGRQCPKFPAQIIGFSSRDLNQKNLLSPGSLLFVGWSHDCVAQEEVLDEIGRVRT